MGLEKALAKQGFLLSTVDAVTNWARANAMWPMPMGLACWYSKSGGKSQDVGPLLTIVQRLFTKAQIKTNRKAQKANWGVHWLHDLIA